MRRLLDIGIFSPILLFVIFIFQEGIIQDNFHKDWKIWSLRHFSFTMEWHLLGFVPLQKRHNRIIITNMGSGVSQLGFQFQFHWASALWLQANCFTSLWLVLRCLSCVWLFVTPWTVAHQAPLSMGFSRQEYWSGLSCPPPGDLPNPGIKPMFLMSPALAVVFFTTKATLGAHIYL